MRRSHSWFFYLCAVEGALALSALLLIPSEGGSISLARLALIGSLVLLSGLGIYLGLRPPPGSDKLARPGIIIAFALLSLIFSLVLFLLRYLNPERLLPIYERLSPLLWYLLVISVQATFFFLVIKYGLRFDGLRQRKLVFLSSLAAFGILLLVFLFVLFTRLGITPDPAYWGEPGVAILGWQFVLALLGGTVVLLLSFRLNERSLDILLPISVYVAAIAIWLSVPMDVLANGFYVTMDAPTFQPFPYSDAGYYDRMAHSLLIGHSYLGEIPTRPLYITFLAFLHKLFGENYPNIIIGQKFLLALIPVVLYLLGRKLHSRIAGVTVALLFIFRELTSLLITSNTRVTNTGSLLVDLPTLFLLLLSCYFSVRWLESRDRKSAYVAGGMFGLLLLLRTQSFLVLPFVLLMALLAFGWRNKLFYQAVFIFVFALGATVTPWLTRNYLRTGQFSFDAAFQYKVIASQYAYSGNLDLSNYDFEGKSLGRVLIEFTLKDPKFVFGFITNHFLATEIDGLLALPLIKPYNGILEPVNLYWMEWDGSLEWYNVLLLIFYLAIIALGVGAAWKRWRWIGLLPLAYNFGYAAATAVGRFSGWRYDLPADWVPYFYFGIGFAELILIASTILGTKEDAPQEGIDIRRNRIPIPAYFVLFAFIGAIPWMAEKLVSPRYPDQSLAHLTEQITSIPNSPLPADIQAFASQPEAFLEIGRVLYPRFYTRDRGLSSSNPWPAFKPREYPRMGFLLMNAEVENAVFPSREIPDPFPHAADAIVFGCRREDYIEVRMIVFPEQDAVLSNAPLSEPCSP